jgi:hypothetical protein
MVTRLHDRVDTSLSRSASAILGGAYEKAKKKEQSSCSSRGASS